MHGPFNPHTSHTHLVDKMIGDAYPIVRHVARNIEYVKHVSHYMENIYVISENIENLQTFLENISIVENLLEQVPLLTDINSNMDAILLVNDNMLAITHVNANIDALLAAETVIEESIETVQGFITEFGDLDTAISVVEDYALTVGADKTAAVDAAGLSQRWANNAEDLPVLLGEYSSKHYSKKSEAFTLKAAQWANAAEDVEVETGEYSARHWAQKAEDSLALNNVSVMHFPGDGTDDPIVLDFAPGSSNNIEVNIKGLGTQPRGIFTVVGMNLYPPTGTVWPLFDPLEADGLTWNIEVVYGNSIDVNTPADDTVGKNQLQDDTVDADKLDGADAANIRTLLGLGSTDTPNFAGLMANGFDLAKIRQVKYFVGTGSPVNNTTTGVIMGDSFGIIRKSTTSKLLVIAFFQSMNTTTGSVNIGSSTSLRYYTGSVYGYMSGTPNSELLDTGGYSSSRILRGSASIIGILTQANLRTDVPTNWTVALFSNAMYASSTHSLATYSLLAIEFEA